MCQRLRSWTRREKKNDELDAVQKAVKDTHSITTTEVGCLHLAEVEGLHPVRGHGMQKLAKSGAGLESEGVSEVAAPQGVNTRTDGDVKGARDRGPLRGLLDDDSVRGADGGRPGSVSGAVDFAAGDGRRLVDAANVAKLGAFITAEALTVVSATGGAEGVVAAVSVLGLVGGDAQGGLHVEPEQDLSDEILQVTHPVVLDEAFIFGNRIAKSSTSHGTHAEDVDVDLIVQDDLVEEPLRHVLRGVVAAGRHLYVAMATGGGEDDSVSMEICTSHKQ